MREREREQKNSRKKELKRGLRERERDSSIERENLREKELKRGRLEEPCPVGASYSLNQIFDISLVPKGSLLMLNKHDSGITPHIGNNSSWDLSLVGTHRAQV